MILPITTGVVTVGIVGGLVAGPPLAARNTAALPGRTALRRANADRETPGTEPTDKNKKPEEASTVQVDREE